MFTWSPGEQRRRARHGAIASCRDPDFNLPSGALATAKGANIDFGDVSGRPVRGPSAQRHLYPFH